MTEQNTSGDDRNIYLDNQGNYRDRTDENLAAYPPAGEAPETPEAEEATDAGTETETGTDAMPPAGKTKDAGKA